MNALMKDSYTGASVAPVTDRRLDDRTGAPRAEICSHALFPPGQRDIFIHHAGSVYKLTITRQNKLILTK